MKFNSNMVSKAKKMFTPSQGKDKVFNGGKGNSVGELESGSKLVDSRFSTGSKEEIFFDSRGWIDSDCEDDYVSAGVDFAPSQGSTPNHQLSTQAPPPQLNKVHFVDDPDSISEPSPNERKKNLSDFLQENNMPGEVVNEQNDATEKLENNGNLHDSKLKTDTTYLSGAHNSEHKKERKKRHCCLPSLIHTRSMNDRRKQKLSPERVSF